MWNPQYRGGIYAVTFAYLLHVVCTTTQATTKDPLKWSELQKLCKLSAFLNKVGQGATKKADTLRSAVEAGQEAQLRALAAAEASSDGNQSAVFVVVAMEAGRCTSQATAKLQTILPKAIKATALAAKATGHISEFVNLLKQLSTGGTGTGYCLKGAAQAAQATTTESGIDCANHEPVTSAAEMPHDDAVMNASGFKQITATPLLETGDGNKCMFLHKGGDTPAATDLMQTTAPKTIVNGFMSISGSNSNTAATFVAANQIAENWAAKNTNSQVEKLYAEARELQTADTENCGATADQVIKNTISSKKVAEILKEAKAAKSKVNPGPPQDEWAESVLATIEKDTGNQAAKIAASIDEQPITAAAGSKSETKPVKQAGGSDALRKSLLLQRMKNRDKLAGLQNQLQEKAKKTTQ
ncbi:Trypanosome variant surface glycoprotein (A-type) [Trypanosoma brucei equiperdum]|uniref:Trypanosome variant surface glycoprotein (A-type) n=1 Tax=Trypanosoma brucei equiperdum TaxID=630700 RepID=A0A3L6L4W8_9TRYP|nr:Trypanosome variant surface glycoprotein (A-type) [Trypanosoma brucei equiperdum]